ncbi:MAG: ATP-binding cassette domain-containing protein [Streptosporangiales bacterium]|nr:ATP-binding cassette domain-containing protein [Streptosporangiales bacterium]
MAELRIDDVSYVDGAGSKVLSNVSLHVADGELMSVVGPSGAGKTTLLRLVAGLESATSGEIRVGDELVNDVPPHKRDVAMAFQRDSTYPLLTVGRNLGFGLEVRKYPKNEIRERVGAEARVLGIGRLLRRMPRTLSLGQRQRVVVGRSLVRVPRVFLLDEPLGNLDAPRRQRLRSEIPRLIKGLGVTALYVTHDQTEAMAVGDRVAVLRDGVLQQVDRPRMLYDRPANLFVAGFIGHQPSSLIRARLRAEGTRAWAVVDDQRLLLGPVAGWLRSQVGRDVVLAARPEHLHETSAGRVTAERRLRVLVRRVARLGTDAYVTCVPAPGTCTEGGKDTELVARFPAHTGVLPGSVIEVAVETEGLHAFDPASGSTLHHGRSAHGD